jgi:hypothetical protein
LASAQLLIIVRAVAVNDLSVNHIPRIAALRTPKPGKTSAC